MAAQRHCHTYRSIWFHDSRDSCRTVSCPSTGTPAHENLNAEHVSNVQCNVAHVRMSHGTMQHAQQLSLPPPPPPPPPPSSSLSLLRTQRCSRVLQDLLGAVKSDSTRSSKLLNRDSGNIFILARRTINWAPPNAWQHPSGFWYPEDGALIVGPCHQLQRVHTPGWPLQA